MHSARLTSLYCSDVIRVRSRYISPHRIRPVDIHFFVYLVSVVIGVFDTCRPSDLLYARWGRRVARSVAALSEGPG